MSLAKTKCIKLNYEVVLSIFIFFSIVIILFSPVQYSNATLNGAKLWVTKILPTLLPFFFLTRLLTELGATQIVSKLLSPVCKKLFNVSGAGAYIFLTGVLCGYPIGAKLTADLVEAGTIDTGEAHRITTLVSTSGPMFVIGTIGAAMFLNAKLGVLVFASHILGAILNGILFRRYKLNFQNNVKIPAEKKHSSFSKILSSSAENSLQSILIVGVYVILFFLFIEIALNIVPIKNGVFVSLFAGIIEITRGAAEVSKHINSLFLMSVLLTFIISFGGISVHLQSLAFLNKCGISYSFFLLQKFTHAAISTLLVCAMFFVFF